MTVSEFELPAQHLRWRCDEAWLPFETTAEVEPVAGVVGQDDAVEALRFGLAVRGSGQNVFIRGLAGTGRATLVQQLLEAHRPELEGAPDRCYVHDFEQPGRPTLISLEPGSGRAFRDRVDELVEFIEQQLGPALSSEAMRARLAAVERRMQERVRELGKPFEEALRASDLALVPVQMGQMVQPTIVPVIDGKPVAPQDVERLRAEGKISEEKLEALGKSAAHFGQELSELNHRVHEAQAGFQAELRELHRDEARKLLAPHISLIEKAHGEPAVSAFLAAVTGDVVGYRLGALERAPEFTRRYRVNLLRCRERGGPAPIVVENAPTLANLLGTIEREFAPGAVPFSDHMMVRSGSLLEADGGFLVLEAREVLADAGAWRILLRTLRTGMLEIVPGEIAAMWAGPLLKPDPIAIDVKVILIGDPGLHQALDAFDPEFPQLFKVLADFETTVARDATGVEYYAGVLARIAGNEGWLPIARSGVAALVEHGARIAGRRERLTTRFGRLADIAREAAFLAREADTAAVTGAHVEAAIRRGRHRADLPARNFRRLVSEGTIGVRTEGRVVGQINGLAVVQAGPLTYGFPTRITATIGPGTAGAVNIEREAELSGAIHTKGFYILGGLLRHLLRTEHPLAFSASIAFEQSYGGIDGDSASGAEMCCLMSALTDVPIDQGVAMTGAIDQHGRIQPIGAVSEKIEGYFGICADRGLDGRQGVLIPSANAGDLMLSREVTEACEQGRFHVYAADTIHEALAVLTAREVPARGEDGAYPDGSLLRLAEERALEYWKKVAP